MHLSQQLKARGYAAAIAVTTVQFLLGCDTDSGERPAAAASSSGTRNGNADAGADSGAPSLGDASTNMPPGSGQSGSGASTDAGPILGQLLNRDAIAPVIIKAKPELDAQCKTGDWPAPVAIAQSPASPIERLLGTTPDGRYWLYTQFTTLPSDATADAGTPVPSEQAHVFDVETETTLLSASADADITRGASISADSLSMTLTGSDGRALLALSRNDSSQPFSLSTTDPFGPLVGLAAQAGLRYSDPTLSLSGQALYLQVSSASNTRTEQYSLIDDTWSLDRPLLGLTALLQAAQDDANKPHRLSAISSDELTLFFWDPATGQARAAGRSHPDVPFSSLESLNLDGPVYPSAECRSLFLLADGDFSVSARP